MKRFCLFFLFAALSALANPGLIYLQKATIDQTLPFDIAESERGEVSPAGTRLYIAAPQVNFSAEELAELPALGVRLEGPIPPNAYILECDETGLEKLKARFQDIFLTEFLPAYKRTFQEETGATLQSFGQNKKRSFLVGILHAEWRASIEERLAALGAEKINYNFDTFEPGFTLWMTEKEAYEVSKWGGVRFIEDYEEPKIECNVVRSKGLANLEDLYLEGYTGRGQTICIHDTGLDNGDIPNLHPDFKKKNVRGRTTTGVYNQRKDWNDWQDAGSHGSHVAGCALGDGTASEGLYHGMAPDADIFVLCAGSTSGGILSGNYSDLTNVYYEGARVMNCSWGSGRGGIYTSSARFEDNLMWEFKDFLICHSAGNYNDNVENPTSRINDQASAKNTIVCGAAQTDRPDQGSGGVPFDGVHQGMASFSSRGPTADGRMKPDIVIPGCSIYATAYDKETTSVRSTYYRYASGTSMASPLVAGCATVVRQYLIENRHVDDPNGSLIKAILIAGARTLYPGQYTEFAEIPNFRPNYVEGHGQVKVKESLEPSGGSMVFFEDTLTATGRAFTNEFTKPADTDLTVALAWTDYPGTSGAAKALVNDLDLYVVAPDNTVYNRDNHLDSTEILYLGNLDPGTYKVIVKAKNIMRGPQPASVVVNCGVANTNPQMALVSEPSFKPGEDTCTIALTNLVELSEVEYSAEILNSDENIFSFQVSTGAFKRSVSLVLSADLERATGVFPSCVFKITGKNAGVITRRIGCPNGREDKGYTLYRANFDNYRAGKLEDFDVAFQRDASVKEVVGLREPKYYDTVYDENFESYETDSSILGKGGWTLGYGIDTNGTTIVRSETIGGVNNKYLEITRINSYYAPHCRINGITSKWESKRAHRYFKCSFRMKLTGNGAKTFTLWTPNTVELTFEKLGNKYTIKSGYSNADYPMFYSERFEEDVWTDVELWIDVINVSGHHVLRKVVINGVAEECNALLAHSGAYDYFTILRLFQWGEGTSCFDNLKIERYISDEQEDEDLILQSVPENSGNGLFFNLNYPEEFAGKYDLIFDVRLLAEQNVVLSQDESSRQFQSEIIVTNGLARPYLTDYKTSPNLISTELVATNYFHYGFRLDLRNVHKYLRKVFFGDFTTNVEGKITAPEVSSKETIKALRLYLPPIGKKVRIASLEARLVAPDHPEIHVSAVPFGISDLQTVWVVTNSAPKEPVTFSARVLEGSEFFKVTPTSGTFTERTELSLEALSSSETPGYQKGILEIDAGEAGVFQVRFGRPTGSLENGYVLYESDFSEFEPGEITLQGANWKKLANERAEVVDTGEETFLRFQKVTNTSAPLAEQGLTCFIGAPNGHSTNLDFHVQAKLRFPVNFSGTFTLTQDELHRQFQTSFSAVSQGTTKLVKTTLTDYTRNTSLLTERAATGVWQPFDLLINALPSQKLLREINFAGEEKIVEKRIDGQYVKKSDEIEAVRLVTGYLDLPFEITDLRVTLEPNVPEPYGVFLLLLLALIGYRRR